MTDAAARAREAHEGGLQEAATEVFNRFFGGSSGLDGMAAEIAMDHAQVAVRGYLTAMQAAGFKLVPREATQEMWRAFNKVTPPVPRKEWEAMLDAAPPLPPEEGG